MKKERGKTQKLVKERSTKLEKSAEKAKHKGQGMEANTELMHGELRSDAYAYAVSDVLSKADSQKGSKNGFLGVESVILNPVEYVPTDKLKLDK